MRYLGEAYAIATLRRGRTIEQFLGQAGDAETPGIKWVEIVPGRDGYEVTLHTRQDTGGEHFCDLLEFPPLVETDEEDFGQRLTVASKASEALEAARAKAGATVDRWVNQGMAAEEYLDYVRAGRPSAGCFISGADEDSETRQALRSVQMVLRNENGVPV